MVEVKKEFMKTKIISILVVVFLLAASATVLSVGKSADKMVRNPEKDSIEKALSFSYSFEKPSTKNVVILGETFTRVSLKGCKLYGETGKPRLPVKPLRILLPQDTTVDKITVKTSEEIVVNDVDNIELGGEIYTLNENPPTSPPDPVYDMSQPYPGTLFYNGGVQYFRGYAILHVNLHPVQYYGDTKTIRYYPEMSIQVTTKPTSHNPLFRGLERDKKLAMAKVDNPDPVILDTYHTVPKRSTTSTSYEWVLITTESFASYSGSHDFNDLKVHRQSQGLTATIKKVEDIYSQYSGVDNQEKIRNFIKDAYQNYGTDWVVLAGDYEYVPIRYLYDIDGGDGTLASDTYYQCLDGNYNYDGDSYYGEKYDGVDGGIIDYYAEVYIGRAAVDCNDQIDNWVRKTIEYDNYDWGSDDWLEVMDSVGEYVWAGAGGWGAGYMERCIDHCTDYGQDTHGIPSQSQPYTNTIMTIQERYERDMEPDWTDEDIEADLNAGLNYINHLGHASPTSCMKWTPQEIDDLVNTKWAFWYTQGCHPGEFQAADECIAEAWTLYDHAGFACIMNTGYGYGSGTDYDGPDNRFCREFWDALYYDDESISRLGVANQDSKEDNSWHMDDGNAMYHNVYSTTLFGDPYCQIKGAEDFGADFHWLENYPHPGETIHFIDDSVGATSYTWQFGDGSTSHQKNPTHTYSTEGVYDVTLTIYGAGQTDSCTKQLEVWENWRPTAVASPDFYAGNNPTINFDGSGSWDPDGTVVSYYWDFDDGATSTAMSPTHTYTLDGIYDVTLVVTDNEGKQSYPAHCEIRIDAYTPPVTEAVIEGSYGNNGWVKGPATIVLQASDWSGVDYTKYRLDGGNWATYIDPVIVYVNGHHIVEFYSVDIYGNVEDTKSTTFKIDHEKPDLDVQIDGERVGEYYVSPVTFTCSATDDVSGMYNIMYRIVGETADWVVYTAPFTVSGDGIHIIRIYAEDNAGNTFGRTEPYVVKIDTNPPTTTCKLSGNLQPDGWYQGDVTVTLETYDTVSGVNQTLYKFDGGSDWSVYIDPIVVSERGRHTIEYYSVDNLGNEETSKSTSFQIGQPPDTPVIKGPTSGKPDVEYTFTITGTHPENLDLWYYVDWGDGTYTDWDGPHASGEEVTLSHTWSTKDTFTIKVKSKDMYDSESNWGTLKFSTPRGRVNIKLLHVFFENIVKRFPMIERLIELLPFQVVQLLAT